MLQCQRKFSISSRQKDRKQHIRREAKVETEIITKVVNSTEIKVDTSARTGTIRTRVDTSAEEVAISTAAEVEEAVDKAVAMMEEIISVILLKIN